MDEEFNPTGSLPSTIELPDTIVNNSIDNYSSTPSSGVKPLDLYTPTYSDKTSTFLENLRADALNGLYSKGNDTLSSIINTSNNKIDISGGYVRANEAYDRLNDGTLLPKYEMYKPGVNNEDYNASLQSNTEKFLNPVGKFVTKVSRGIVGDIASFVYGVGEAALTGRAESLFDNSAARYIDDLDKKSDFAYKNYYTEAQNGLGANLYTWDKVLGGAEFTARMIGAEAVIALATGGTSLPASFARTGARLGIEAGVNASRVSRATRALRAAETLEDISQVGRRASEVTRIATEPVAAVARQGGGVFSAERYARGLDESIRAGKLVDNLKQARFAVTGSAYEAGFEARHYQEEAENAFWEYHRANGTEPTQQEVVNFQEKLDKTAWGVFGANMAILSVSNLALFGNMLNIKNPFPKLTTNSFFDRSVFKIGTERTAEGIWKPLKSNFFNKALAYSAPVAKGAFTEGIFEEGGQGIASGMMKNYMASTYDPKAMKETANYASAFTKAFKDQYSTKEGLEEVIIGGIIGGLFGGVGGVRNVNAQYENQEFVSQVQNAMPQVADNIVRNLYTNENLSNVLGHSNRLQNINERVEQARNNGDVTATALHSAESFISMLQASASVGKTDEFMTILKDSLRGMNAEELAQGQNISLDSVEDFKNDKIKGIETLSENYSKAREAAGYIFGRGAIGGFYEVEGNKVNRQNLIDAFAYTSAMGSVSQQIAGDSFSAFQNKLAEVGASKEVSEQFGAVAALQAAGQLEATRYTQATEEQKRLQSQKQKLEEQIVRTQREEQTGETAEKLQNLGRQLLDLGIELEQTNQNRNIYWKSIADNFYKNLGQSETGFLPQIDFDNFNNQAKDLQTYLNNSSISEFDRLELNKLLDEFNKSNTAFKSFNNLANTLADKKFTFKTYNSIFSGLRGKNDSSLNDVTKEALINLYNTDTKVGQTITTYQPTSSIITQEVLDQTKEEGYELSDDIRDFLVEKKKNKQTLTENEQQVYDAFKDNIDEIVNRVNEDPINEVGEQTQVSQNTAEISARRKELRQLRNGEITPEIQSEINRIDEEIAELEKNLASESSTTQEQKTDSNQSPDDLLKRVKNKELFKDGGMFANILGGSGVDSILSDYREIGGIEFLQWSNPNTGDVDVIMTGTGNHDFVGFYRIYENGQPTNKWSSKFENQSRNKANFKSMISNVQDMLPQGHEYTEKTSISTDGLRVWEQQLKNGYEIATDSQGNPITNEVMINGDSIINDLGVSVNAGQFDPVTIRTQEEYDTAKKSILPKLQKLGLSEENIRWDKDNNTIKIDLPLLRKKSVPSNNTTQQIENYLDSIQERTENGFLTIPNLKTKTYNSLNIGDDIFIFAKGESKRGVITSKNNASYGITVKLEDGSSYNILPALARIYSMADINQLRGKSNEIDAEQNVTEIGSNDNEETLSKIKELEDSKDFIVQDRIDDLETQIEELKNKDTTEKRLSKRKETLSLKISNLKNQILLEIGEQGFDVDNLKVDKKSPYYPKVRKMRRLERQLRDLDNIQEDFNPDASYKEQLDWVVDNFDLLDYENVETLTSVSPPSQEDVSKFKELDSKSRKTKTEKEEYETVKKKLLPYRLIEGSFFGGIPLIDIIDVYNQSKNNSTSDENQVQKLTEPQVQETIKKVQSPEIDPEFRAPNVGLVYDGAYVKGAVGNQSIHHVRLETILNKGFEQGLNMTVTEYTSDKDGNETFAETQEVTSDNIGQMARKYDNFQGVVINIGEDIVLDKSPRGSYFVSRRADIIPFLGYEAYAITGQPNAYNLLYDQKSDGTWSSKESEYEVTRDGRPVPFDKETLNSIKAGDNVTLFYDPNDDYNKTLKKKELAEKANIYIMKNGNLVNILKSSPQYRDKNETWAQLSNLRKEVIENGTAQIKVKSSYMGLPNIVIDENGKAIELPIEESMVESYGYIDIEGNYKYFNNVNVDNTQYTDPYREMGKSIPIVAFNYNNKVYTFPIQVDSVTGDATGELDDILSSENLNEYQKIFQVNNLLDKYGILTDSLRLTSQNDTLLAIREALTSVGDRIDVTNREDVQNALKTILIDMNDPFMSAKLVLDLKSAGEILDEMEEKMKNETIEPYSDIGSDLADENMC